MPENTGITQTAANAARHLTTRTASKKHGGYQIYEDGKVVICLDTYVPNLDIQVIGPDGERITVFSAAYHSWHNPSIHRPGAWVQHILDLQPKIQEVKDRKEREDQARQDENARRRYGPIDDSATFAPGA